MARKTLQYEFVLVVNTLCLLDIMKAAQLSDSRHVLHAVHNVDFETVFS